MAPQWKDLPFQALRKAVLVMSTAMLVYQVYLSIKEFQKQEYVQVSEDSTLAKVTLPMLIVCHEKAVDQKNDLYFYSGMDASNNFEGWSRNNMKTMDYLQSIITVEEEKNFTSLISESLMPGSLRLKSFG